jgi:hypothetical protein
MSEGQGCMAAMMGCAFGLVIGLGIYLFCCWALSKLGAKFQVGPTWGYYVPIYNLVLLCQCAQINPLWILVVLVPGFGGVVFTVYLYGTIAARLGKEFWLWGLLCILQIPVFVLALDDSRPVENPTLPNFGS